MVRVCWAEQLEVDRGAHDSAAACRQERRKALLFRSSLLRQPDHVEYERRPSQRLGLPVSITLQQRHIPPHAIPRVVAVNNHPVKPWEARAQEASLGYVAF